MFSKDLNHSEGCAYKEERTAILGSPVSIRTLQLFHELVAILSSFEGISMGIFEKRSFLRQSQSLVGDY